MQVRCPQAVTPPQPLVSISHNEFCWNKAVLQCLFHEEMLAYFLVHEMCCSQYVYTCTCALSHHKCTCGCVCVLMCACACVYTSVCRACMYTEHVPVCVCVCVCASECECGMQLCDQVVKV